MSTNPVLVPPECHPLPTFREDTLLPYTTGFMPQFIWEVSEVSDEDFPLWVARMLQQYPLSELLSVAEPGDMTRYWLLLKMTHDRVHNMMESACSTPGTEITSVYLALLLIHESVTLAMTVIAHGKDFSDGE